MAGNNIHGMNLDQQSTMSTSQSNDDDDVGIKVLIYQINPVLV